MRFTINLPLWYEEIPKRETHYVIQHNRHRQQGPLSPEPEAPLQSNSFHKEEMPTSFYSVLMYQEPLPFPNKRWLHCKQR